MNIYIIEIVEQASSGYHSGGGLAVIAEDKAAAQALLDAEEYVEVTEAEWEGAISYPLKGKHEERVFVFPDAGCC